MKNTTKAFAGENVDKLPDLVSGDGNEKLLGVPNMKLGTGKTETNCICDLLEQWKMNSTGVTACYDA